MKRKISLALVLSIVLGLALIGTAYALLASPRVAEFFTRHWNQELGTSLQDGKAAQIGESVTVGDVVFTLDEIVYKDRALYGVGTVRPVNENDVIVPMDMAEDSEYFLMNEEARKLVAKAKASGGRILTASSMPQKIGVDEGTMLMPGCIGYYDVPNEDGSVTYSFEASDGFAVNEGTSYQIRMESYVKQIDGNGKVLEGSMQHAEWTVSCVPAVMNTATDKPDLPDAGAAVIEQDGYELLVPETYQETKTMPVFQAVEVDFTASADPEWFNHSGVKEGPDKTVIHFNDHAVLSLSPEALFYHEYADDEYTETDSGRIVGILGVRNWEGHTGEFILDRTALSGISLEEAKARAKELMTRLGIDCNQYVCEEALDLSLDRIQAMGAIWEKAIADGELFADDHYKPYDYASIPAGEEGYYLRYYPLGVDTTEAGGRSSVELFVNSRGIAYAAIRNQYNRGEIVETPETLITPDAAIVRLTEELGRSLFQDSKTIKSIQRVALTYEAVRAENKSEGMVFAPVWLIVYQDESAARNHSSCYALINAVDGALIDASFR